MKNVILAAALVSALAGAVHAQTGGVYEIKQSVSANGGGSVAGGSYSLDGTAGQTLTGRSTQSPVTVESGFWLSSFTPTAAFLSVSGRVRHADGRGIKNAIVTSVQPDGTIRNVRTGSFGFYRFDDLRAGETIVISVKSKRFRFQPLILTISESITDADFTSDEQNIAR